VALVTMQIPGPAMLFYPDVLSVLVYLAAGGCLFLLLLNRILLQRPDSPRKQLIIPTNAAAIGLVSLVAWYFGRASAWLALPAGVLAAVVLGEARRLVMRRRMTGAGPVELTATPLSLAVPFTTTDLALARYEVESPRWRGPALRIAHLSDLHVDDRLAPDYYETAIARAVATEPDLMIFTGDFISRRECIPLLTDLLRGARARLGVWAVLGNHDYWADGPAVARAVAAAGIEVLGNDCRRLRVGDGDLLLCGCEHPWGNGPRGQSLDHWQPPQPGPEQLTVALTHTPDNVYRLSRAGMDMIFAGHYHAGQFRLPLLGSVVIPSRYGRRFDHGHFVVGGSSLFVSAGVGASAPPFRLYCRPDIFVVDIRPRGERGR
jgi:predicted MPP superfamily phosphohydrolase